MVKKKKVSVLKKEKHQNEIKEKIDKISKNAPLLKGKGNMIALDPGNNKHREWFEDDN